MSAFLVDNSSINKIVEYMRKDREAVFFKRKLLKMGFDIEKNPAIFGRAIYQMNCDAVNSRYEEGTDKQDRPEGYTYRLEIPGNQFQTYKSLHCLLYQCTEGTVPELPLFKLIEEYTNHVAHSIITSMPEYENAKWE